MLGTNNLKNQVIVSLMVIGGQLLENLEDPTLFGPLIRAMLPYASSQVLTLILNLILNLILTPTRTMV